MAEDAKEMKEDSARADAEKRADEKLDLLLRGIDSLRADIASCNSRMDAWEEEKKKADAEDNDEEDKHSLEMGEGKKKVDAEEEKEDSEEEPIAEKTKPMRLAADKGRKDSKGRKDADEEEKMDADEEEKERADAADVRRILAEQAETIKRLSELVRQPIPESYRAELTSAQARADEALTQLGDRAPQPLVGETPFMYRRRITDSLKKYSDRWKDIKLDGLDDKAFEQIEQQVYADAAVRAKSPNDIGMGKMREVRKTTPSGHVVTEFYGNGTHFVKQFSRPVRRVRSIRTGN